MAAVVAGARVQITAAARVLVQGWLQYSGRNTCLGGGGGWGECGVLCTYHMGRSGGGTEGTEAQIIGCNRCMYE